MLRVAPTTALALLISVAPSVAAADSDQGQRLSDAGKQAYRKGAFQAAAEAFEAAYEADDLPKYRFNAAKAWEKHGDMPRAIAAYQDYLELHPEAEDAEDVGTTLALLDYKLRKGAGLVRVTSEPSGARYLMKMADEGRRGTTPDDVWAAPGRWSLRLEKVGYAPVDRDVVVLVGVEQDIHSVLEPGEAGATVIAAKAEKRPTARTSQSPDRFGVGSWSSFAVAGAAVLGGALLTTMSWSKLTEYQDYVADKDDPAHTREAAENLAISAEGLSATGVVLFGVAGAAAATGLLLPVVQGTW